MADVTYSAEFNIDLTNLKNGVTEAGKAIDTIAQNAEKADKELESMGESGAEAGKAIVPEISNAVKRMTMLENAFANAGGDVNKFASIVTDKMAEAGKSVGQIKKEVEKATEAFKGSDGDINKFNAALTNTGKEAKTQTGLFGSFVGGIKKGFAEGGQEAAKFGKSIATALGPATIAIQLATAAFNFIKDAIVAAREKAKEHQATIDSLADSYRQLNGELGKEVIKLTEEEKAQARMNVALSSAANERRDYAQQTGRTVAEEEASMLAKKKLEHALNNEEAASKKMVETLYASSLAMKEQILLENELGTGMDNQARLNIEQNKLKTLIAQVVIMREKGMLETESYKIALNELDVAREQVKLLQQAVEADKAAEAEKQKAVKAAEKAKTLVQERAELEKELARNVNANNVAYQAQIAAMEKGGATEKQIAEVKREQAQAEQAIYEQGAKSLATIIAQHGATRQNAAVTFQLLDGWTKTSYQMEQANKLAASYDKELKGIKDDIANTLAEQQIAQEKVKGNTQEAINLEMQLTKAKRETQKVALEEQLKELGVGADQLREVLASYDQATAGMVNSKTNELLADKVELEKKVNELLNNQQSQIQKNEVAQKLENGTIEEAIKLEDELISRERALELLRIQGLAEYKALSEAQQKQYIKGFEEITAYQKENNSSRTEQQRRELEDAKERERVDKDNAKKWEDAQKQRLKLLEDEETQKYKNQIARALEAKDLEKAIEFEDELITKERARELAKLQALDGYKILSEKQKAQYIADFEKTTQLEKDNSATRKEELKKREETEKQFLELITGQETQNLKNAIAIQREAKELERAIEFEDELITKERARELERIQALDGFSKLSDEDREKYLADFEATTALQKANGTSRLELEKKIKEDEKEALKLLEDQGVQVLKNGIARALEAKDLEKAIELEDQLIDKERARELERIKALDGYGKLSEDQQKKYTADFEETTALQKAGGSARTAQLQKNKEAEKQMLELLTAQGVQNYKNNIAIQLETGTIEEAIRLEDELITKERARELERIKALDGYEKLSDEQREKYIADFEATTALQKENSATRLEQEKRIKKAQDDADKAAKDAAKKREEEAKRLLQLQKELNALLREQYTTAENRRIEELQEAGRLEEAMRAEIALEKSKNEIAREAIVQQIGTNAAVKERASLLRENINLQQKEADEAKAQYLAELEALKSMRKAGSGVSAETIQAQEAMVGTLKEVYDAAAKTVSTYKEEEKDMMASLTKAGTSLELFDKNAQASVGAIMKKYEALGVKSTAAFEHQMQEDDLLTAQKLKNEGKYEESLEITNRVTRQRMTAELEAYKKSAEFMAMNENQQKLYEDAAMRRIDAAMLKDIEREKRIKAVTDIIADQAEEQQRLLIEKAKENHQYELAKKLQLDLIDTQRARGLEEKKLSDAWKHMTDTQRKDYEALWHTITRITKEGVKDEISAYQAAVNSRVKIFKQIETQEKLNVKTSAEANKARLSAVEQEIEALSKLKDEYSELKDADDAQLESIQKLIAALLDEKKAAEELVKADEKRAESLKIIKDMQKKVDDLNKSEAETLGLVGEQADLYTELKKKVDDFAKAKAKAEANQKFVDDMVEKMDNLEKTQGEILGLTEEQTKAYNDAKTAVDDWQKAVDGVKKAKETVANVLKEWEQSYKNVEDEIQRYLISQDSYLSDLEKEKALLEYNYQVKIDAHNLSLNEALAEYTKRLAVAKTGEEQQKVYDEYMEQYAKIVKTQEYLTKEYNSQNGLLEARNDSDEKYAKLIQEQLRTIQNQEIAKAKAAGDIETAYKLEKELFQAIQEEERAELELNLTRMGIWGDSRKAALDYFDTVSEGKEPKSPFKNFKESALDAITELGELGTGVLDIMDNIFSDQLTKIQERLEAQTDIINEYYDAEMERLEELRNAALEAAGFVSATSEEGLAEAMEAAIASQDEKVIYLEEQRQKELAINREFDRKALALEQEKNAKLKAEDEKAKREAAELEYKMAMGQWLLKVSEIPSIIATAMARSFAAYPFPFNAVMAGLAAAATIAQTTVILTSAPKKQYAKGAAFANGTELSDGVYSAPTDFSIGRMGEAGPEAIIPLARTASGELGVNANSQKQMVNLILMVDSVAWANVLVDNINRNQTIDIKPIGRF